MNKNNKVTNKREIKKLEQELKALELKMQEIVLRKNLDSLDPEFDKKLKCCLKTPPLKLKDLKEQLKREREGKQSSS
jgi:hypothetical protein